VWGHPNGREGIEAFNEKRKPVYTSEEVDVEAASLVVVAETAW